MRSKTNLRRNFPLPYLPIIIGPVILLSPVLFTGKALFWGTPALQFIPWWQWAFDTLLSGHLPLWNPLVGMGAPLIANYQSALFYPPNWIFFLFYVGGGITALAWSQALVVVLHLIWAGMGMVQVIRRLELGRLAQTIGGLAFSLSGYLITRAWFASVITTVAWLPWVLVLSFDLVHRKRPRRTLLKLGFIIGLQLLAGHAQTTWYTWLLAGLWIGFWSWQNPQQLEQYKFGRLKVVGRNWVLLGVAVLLGLGLAAIQLIPTAEYLMQSQRSTAVDYELAMGYSFWPWRFVGLLAPNFFGSQALGDYWGYGSFWEDAIYIGLIPILLALATLRNGLFSSKKNSNLPHKSHQPYPVGFIRFLLTVIIIAFIFALGDNTVIFPWLYKNVPTFSMFRSPTRFSIWAVFALAVLSSYGVEYWHKPVGRSLYWTRLGTMGAFAIMLGAGLGWWVLRDLVTDFRPTFVSALALAGLWGVGAGLSSLMAKDDTHPPTGHSSIWVAGVVLLVFTDLLVAGWGHNPSIAANFYQLSSENLTPPPSNSGLRVLLHPKTEDEIKYKQYFTLDTFDPHLNWDDLYSIPLPNLNMMQRIPVVNNYDPLVPGRYAQWMEKLADRDLQNYPSLLDIMAVDTLVWTEPISATTTTTAQIAETQRVRWVPCARSAKTSQKALDLVFSGDVNFNAEVVLEGITKVQNQECFPIDYSSKIVSETPNAISIQVDTLQPGWLVFSDIHYPGWKAFLNNEVVEIYSGNFLFRAVEVPVGQHEIKLIYQPWSFYSGVLISITTWLGLLYTWKFWNRLD